MTAHTEDTRPRRRRRRTLSPSIRVAVRRGLTVISAARVRRRRACAYADRTGRRAASERPRPAIPTRRLSLARRLSLLTPRHVIPTILTDSVMVMVVFVFPKREVRIPVVVVVEDVRSLKGETMRVLGARLRRPRRRGPGRLLDRSL